MTDKEYSSWVDRHSAMFGMSSEGDPAMFLAWRSHFELMGYTAEELASATTALASDAKVAEQKSLQLYRSSQLAFINFHIATLRRRADAKPKQENTGKSRCSDCLDSGLMPVPHLRCVKDDGSWDGTEVLISCHCFKGRSINDRDSDYKPMSFADYCGKNPGFREQIAWKKRILDSHYKVREVSEGHDIAKGPLRKLVAAIAKPLDATR